MAAKLMRNHPSGRAWRRLGLRSMAGNGQLAVFPTVAMASMSRRQRLPDGVAVPAGLFGRQQADSANYSVMSALRFRNSAALCRLPHSAMLHQRRR